MPVTIARPYRTGLTLSATEEARLAALCEDRQVNRAELLRQLLYAAWAAGPGRADGAVAIADLDDGPGGAAQAAARADY